MRSIIELNIENVMGIKAFHYKPEGAAIIIGGENGAGKSSVLDSICMLIGGKSLCPPEPLRRGKNRGKVEATIQSPHGDLLAIRTWERKADGTVKTELELKSKDGYNAPTPQTILNDMGVLFDPLEFMRMKPKDQLKALQELVGLDLSEIDEKRAAAFTTRTSVNSAGKEKAAQLKAVTIYEGVPDEELSSTEILQEMDVAEKKNRENDRIRQAKVSSDQALAKHANEMTLLESRILELEESLAAAKADLETAKAKHVEMLEADQKALLDVAELADVDIAAIRDKLKDMEETNRRVRSNKRYAELNAEVNRLRERSQELSDEIKALDTERERQLSEAKFPVEGLGFGDSGITFDGLPFEQANSAMKLRTSVAMGIASKPGGRVMIIRDGALLDSTNLPIIAEMAEAADCQVWIERVGLGKECSVIVQDGEIAELAETAGV